MNECATCRIRQARDRPARLIVHVKANHVDTDVGLGSLELLGELACITKAVFQTGGDQYDNPGRAESRERFSSEFDRVGKRGRATRLDLAECRQNVSRVSNPGRDLETDIGTMRSAAAAVDHEAMWRDIA